MLYMVELRYQPEQRDPLLHHFETHGLTHHGWGVVIKGAWVAKARIVYLVVESRRESEFDKACQTWSELADLKSTPVIDADQVL